MIINKFYKRTIVQNVLIKILLIFILMNFHYLQTFCQSNYKIIITEVHVNNTEWDVKYILPKNINIGDDLKIIGYAADIGNGLPIPFVDIGVSDGCGLLSSVVTTNVTGYFEYSTNVIEETQSSRNIMFTDINYSNYTHIAFSIYLPPFKDLYSNSSLSEEIPYINANHSLQTISIKSTDDLGIPYLDDRDYVTQIVSINGADDVTIDNYHLVLAQYQLNQTDPYFTNPEIKLKAENIYREVNTSRFDEYSEYRAKGGPVSLGIIGGQGAACAATGIACVLFLESLAIEVVRGTAIVIMQDAGVPPEKIEQIENAIDFTLVILYPDPFVKIGALGDLAYRRAQIDNNLEVIDVGYDAYLNNLQPFSNSSFFEKDGKYYLEWEYSGKVWEAELDIFEDDVNYVHDYSIENITYEPIAPISNSTVTINAAVKNLGSELEIGGQSINLYIDNVFVNSTQILPELSPGEESIVTFLWMADEGNHNIKVETILPNDEYNSNNSKSVIISVEQNCSETPILISPADNEKNVNRRPNFDWEEMSGGVKYDFAIYQRVNGLLNQIYYRENLVASDYYPPSYFTLNYGENYKWTVRSIVDNERCDWAILSDFDVRERLDVPQLVLPENNSTNLSLMPTLEWQDVQGADYYRVLVSFDESGKNDLEDWSPIIGNTFQIPIDELEEATEYYWFVRAYMSNGDRSEYSLPFKFTTGGAVPPGPPLPILPIDIAVDQSLNVELSWEDSKGVTDTYNFQIATDDAFTNIVFEVTNWKFKAYVVDAGILDISTDYYWRLSGNNSSGIGIYSQPRIFTTTSVPPPYGNVLWSKSISNFGTAIPVFDDEGFLYIGERDLTKIDPFTGEVIWTKELYSLDELDAGPTISHDGEILYTIIHNAAPEVPESDTYYLGSLTKEGELIWYADLKSVDPYKSVLDSQGNIYVTMDEFEGDNYRNAIVSYSPDGSFRWREIIDQPKSGIKFVSNPIVSGNILIVSEEKYLISSEEDYMGRIYGIRISDGNIVWTKTLLNDQVVYENPAVTESFGVFNTRNNQIYVLSLSTGSELGGWPKTSPEFRNTTASIDANNIIYTGHDLEDGVSEGKIQAFTSGGSLVWENNIVEDMGRTSVLGDNNILYFHNDNGQTIFAVDRETGGEIWSTNIGVVAENISMGPNGYLYVGTRDQNRLFALSTSATGVDKSAHWPMKFKDYQATGCYDGQDILFPPIGISSSQGKYSDKIVIDWETNVIYDSILVYRSEHQDSPFVYLGYATAENYVDQYVEVNLQYYYQLKALKDGVYSAMAPTNGVLGFAQWNEPHHLYATQGHFDNKVIIEWKPPVNKPINYDVSRSYFKDEGYQTIKTGLTDTFYVNSNLPVGTQWYRVRADYGDSVSFWSIPISGWKSTEFEYFVNYPTQGKTYPVVVQNIDLNGEPLENGDEIGIFDIEGDGIGLVGAKLFDGTVPLTINTHLETIVDQEVLPGAKEGHTITVKIWDKSSNNTIDMNPIFTTGGSFGAGMASNISELTATELYLISIRILLEGAYLDGTNMSTDLSDLPRKQPFSIEGWNYPGLESINVIPSNVVDWVMLELRDKTDNSVVRVRRAALLLNNGDVVDMDGTSPVSFAVPIDDYYVVVKHRNHLSIMSSSPIPFITETPLIKIDENQIKERKTK